MISLGANHRYFLYTQVTGMRKTFDGLSGLVRNQMDKIFWMAMCSYF